eukprot:Gb_34347 [translate_table: standard]
MPKCVDYSSYTNRKVASEFIHTISEYLERIQEKKMLESPFFSLMLDESIDRSLEKHLIVYTIFLDSKDGASSMVGSENGFVTLLKKDLPNLICIHCIAHREALVTSDASKKIPELMYIEKLANKVYSWVGNSTKRNNELHSLQEVMELESLQVLQIHGIRWLSRGQVIERLVAIIPAILSLWKRQTKGS